MIIETDNLKYDEQAVFLLRSLYSKYGYKQYKMRKFEEYDLYVRNKDFLISDSVITFTDTNGKLMALKPDVTLSIVKNTKDSDGSVQKYITTKTFTEYQRALIHTRKSSRQVLSASATLTLTVYARF